MTNTTETKQSADETLITMAEVTTMLNLSHTKVWTMIQKDEPVSTDDFATALKNAKPQVSEKSLQKYQEWENR